jgi:hypothetical protein
MKTIVRGVTNGAVRTRTKFALLPIYNRIGKDDDGYALYERFWLQWVRITEIYRSGYDDYGWERHSVEAV